MPEPAYLKVLLEHLRLVPLEKGVTHIDVYHDDACAIFDGNPCNCEPSVASGPLVQSRYEGEDGA